MRTMARGHNALMTTALALLAAPCGGAKLSVMVNGIPGAMGREIAAACLRRDGVTLVPYATKFGRQIALVQEDDD